MHCNVDAADGDDREMLYTIIDIGCRLRRPTIRLMVHYNIVLQAQCARSAEATAYTSLYAYIVHINEYRLNYTYTDCRHNSRGRQKRGRESPPL